MSPGPHFVKHLPETQECLCLCCYHSFEGNTSTDELTLCVVMSPTNATVIALELSSETSVFLCSPLNVDIRDIQGEGDIYLN